MKKLFKFIPVAALALMMTGCKDKDMYGDGSAAAEITAAEKVKSYEQTFAAQFGSIAADQNFNTSESFDITVTAPYAGTVRVYTTMPNAEGASYLVSQSFSAGETKTLSVAKPKAVDVLYVALIDDDYSYRIEAVSMDGATVDFSSNTASSSLKNVTRAFSLKADKAIGTAPEYPSGTDESNFVSSVPSDATLISGSKAGGGKFYINETVTNLNWYSLAAWDAATSQNVTSDGYLYITGTVTPSDGFFIPQNVKVYVCEGATLNLTASQAAKVFAYNEWYIAEGATINVTDDNTTGLNASSAMVYNHGTINATSYSTNGTSMLYNYSDGKVVLSGEFAVKNAGSVIVNYGDIECGAYNSEGSGGFYNSGKITVSGDALVNSNSNAWVNDGVFSCVNFTYNAGSNRVYNNCKMYASGLFKLLLGDGENGIFQIQSGGSVVAGSFYMGIGYVYMGAGALIDVTGDMTMDIKKADYGFYGLGDSPAVISAGNIVAGTPGASYLVTYEGNLAVAYSSHFEQGYSGHYPYYVQGENVKMYPNGKYSADVTIKENGDCSPGYNGKTEDDPESPEVWSIAFEDMGVIGDFDFNDIVLYVTAPENNKSKVYVMAAGGTLAVDVLYNNEVIYHKDSVSSMEGFNTYEWGKVLATKEITLADGTNIAQDNVTSMFKINVTQENGAVTSASARTAAGATPQAIVIDGAWSWPYEQTSITKVYTNFKEWVGGKDIEWNPTGKYITPTNWK